MTRGTGGGCWRCGAETDPTAATCRKCGASSATNRGERKQISVLFCDLVGSTALSGRLDPEELRDLLRSYQDTCARIVERLDGHLAQFLGDGILIYFGYPTSHEDDPARAVEAGLEIADAVSTLQFPQLGGKVTNIGVRVGIHTGLIVAAELGHGPRRETLALGSTPNIAAKLQNVCAANGVCVSAQTCELTRGHFEYDEIQRPIEIGNQIVRAYQARRTASRRSRFEHATSGGLSPFQGRTAELKALHALWERVAAGRGQLAVVAGEPGIGKSRLLHELRQSPPMGDALWLPAQASTLASNSTFMPIIGVLRALVGDDPGDDDVTRAGRLASWLAQIGMPDPASLAVLAALLGIRPGALPDLPSGLGPERKRRETIRCVIQLLEKLGEQRPVVLCLEDAQWLDPSTLELMDELVGHLPTTRLLLALTARSEFRHSWPQGSQPQSLRLSGLSAFEIGNIVRSLTGSASLDPTLESRIVDRADGVVLFAEELTKATLEADAHAPAGNVERTVDIPITLLGSLTARLDRLRNGKKVAQIGAVLGREFAQETLVALGVLDGATVAAGIAELLQANLLSALPTGHDTFWFRHALVQDTAYSSLLISDRRVYHERIGHTLLRLAPTLAREQPELIAHHFTEASSVELAFPHWLEAAQRSADRCANREALTHVKRALSLISRLPEGRDRWERELSLQMVAGQAGIALEGCSDQVRSTYQRALELSGALESAEPASNTALLSSTLKYADDLSRASTHPHPEGDRLFWILWGFGAYYQTRSEFRKSLALGERLIQLSRADPELMLEGHFGAGSTLFFLGEFEKAQVQLTAGWECYTSLHRAGHTSPTGHHAEVECLGYLSLVLWNLGFGEAAEAQATLGLSTARKTNYDYAIASALTSSAWLAQMRQDTSETLTHAGQALDMADRHGFALVRAWARPAFLWAQLKTTGDRSAIAGLEAELEGYNATGYRLADTYFRAILAECLLATGEVDRAFEVLERARLLAMETEERFWEAEIYRLQGEACARSTNLAQDPPRIYFERALRLAIGQKSVALQKRIRASMATLPRDAELDVIGPRENLTKDSSEGIH